MYTYKAVVTKCYDGDTVTIDIDLGFGIWKKKESVRLSGIDTPELRGSTSTEKKKAVAARDFLADLIMGKEIMIDSQKKDKYGRYLVVIYIKSQLKTINQVMIDEGHARQYFGGKKETWIF